MSLIGSLEDLSLGDILQIINLSQKSGVLSVCGDGGEGRIVFREGLVRAAVVKGGPSDLRDVLLGAGFVTTEAYAEAERAAQADDLSLEVALERHTSLPRERIDSLAREAVESAVVEMFTWLSGEFSFDLRVESEPGDPAIFLELGINAQYLAMEGTRLLDESELGSPFVESEPSVSELLSAQPVFEEADEPEARSGELLPRAAELQALGEDSPTEDATPSQPVPLIVIDSELRGLEWVKQVLCHWVDPIHIFQRSDLGLVRIRQYLARAELPLVLISPALGADPLTGIKDSVDFVRRLKAQSPGMRVFWLCEDGGEPLGELRPADGLVVRPGSQQFATTRAHHQIEALSQALRRSLEPLLVGKKGERRGDGGLAGVDEREISMASFTRLKDVTARLRESSVRGDVLPFVLRFAAESFSRVALFVVRDEGILGIAQSGLARAGGPDDVGMRDIRFGMRDVEWFRRVIEGHRPLRSGPGNDGDRMLSMLIGDRAPEEAFIAPIESSGRVIAILYADQLPAVTAIGDTSALEVVIQHAGLALDRAVLKRALHKLETSSPEPTPRASQASAEQTRPGD